MDISIFSDSFMPHGHCYMWKPEILWMHVISDALIFLSYLGIPLSIAYVVYRSGYRLPFNKILILFSLFIITCGTSHLMAIVNVWNNEYFISGIIKSITAITSVATFIVLIPELPKIIEFARTQSEEKPE